MYKIYFKNHDTNKNSESPQYLHTKCPWHSSLSMYTDVYTLRASAI